MELNHAPRLCADMVPSVVTRRDDDLMVDEYRYDALTARLHCRRTVLRANRRRSFEFSHRISAFPELRDWLLAAGFHTVEGFDIDGSPLTAHARRIVVRAVR